MQKPATDAEDVMGTHLHHSHVLNNCMLIAFDQMLCCTVEDRIQKMTKLREALDMVVDSRAVEVDFHNCRKDIQLEMIEF